MAVLNKEDFMKQLKNIIGDKDDDETLKFLEDANDTISSKDDDYKTKYETLLTEKETLDKEWRAKYKARFFDDANNNDNNNNNNNNLFDERTDEEKKAESISIDDLFKPAE